jgi:flagellar basal body-associated protein FliL
VEGIILSAEQLEKKAMGTITTILLLVLYGLFLAGGIYFESYFNMKGENLATKEDFKELKSQTAELRQATKEIEAKIDNQIWSGQRQWELK